MEEGGFGGRGARGHLRASDSAGIWRDEWRRVHAEPKWHDQDSGFAHSAAGGACARSGGGGGGGVGGAAAWHIWAAVHMSCAVWSSSSSSSSTIIIRLAWDKISSMCADTIRAARPPKGASTTTAVPGEGACARVRVCAGGAIPL